MQDQNPSNIPQMNMQPAPQYIPVYTPMPTPMQMESHEKKDDAASFAAQMAILESLQTIQSDVKTVKKMYQIQMWTKWITTAIWIILSVIGFYQMYGLLSSAGGMLGGLTGGYGTSQLEQYSTSNTEGAAGKSFLDQYLGGQVDKLLGGKK